jgi:hypothetical protein
MLTTPGIWRSAGTTANAVVPAFPRFARAIGAEQKIVPAWDADERGQGS